MSKWDIRVPVSVLHDPDYLRLSPEAFTALVLLQCMSARGEITDGHVLEKHYRPSRGYLGLPIVPPEALDGAITELEEAGLLERVPDGVEVIWEHQTTARQVRDKRDGDAERKRQERERKKLLEQAGERSSD